MPYTTFSTSQATAYTTPTYVTWYVTSTASTDNGTALTCAADPIYGQERVAYRAYHNYAAEQERQADTMRRHRRKAKERAQELLLANLTPEQRRTLKDNKWFVVEGGKSKQKYRIRAEDHLVGNIDVIEGAGVKYRLCAHCDLKAVPHGDQLLAQKLMLEFAEDDFLRVANRHAA